MALFFFDTDDGHCVVQDRDGSEFASPDEALSELRRVLPALARDTDADRVSVIVRTADGRQLGRATLTIVVNRLAD
jgi:hypothetical protein